MIFESVTEAPFGFYLDVKITPPYNPTAGPPTGPRYAGRWRPVTAAATPGPPGVVPLLASVRRTTGPRFWAAAATKELS